MQKKIIILGASRYYSKCIESAREAGYYVIAVDRNPESEGFAAADLGIACDIVDKEGVLALAKEHQVNGIVPVNDYGVPTAAWVSTQLGLPGISPEVAELATNKELMRKEWIAKGVNCPKVEVVNHKSEFQNAIDKVGLPVIFKPAHGIGGASRGVIVVRAEEEIEEAIEFTTSFYDDHTTLVESFIDAEVEHSAEVIVHNRQAHVIAIADKIKTPLPFRVDKNVLYPTRIEGDRLAALKTAIGESVLALGINDAVAHVEIATLKDGGFCLFELGARCGGGGTPDPIVKYCTGVHEFVEFVRILSGDEPSMVKPDRNLGCNYHFLTPEPGKLTSVTGEENVLALDEVLDFELFIKGGQKVPPVTVGTERAGFIIATGKDRESALQNGIKAEAMLHFEYE